MLKGLLNPWSSEDAPTALPGATLNHAPPHRRLMDQSSSSNSNKQSPTTKNATNNTATTSTTTTPYPLDHDETLLDELEDEDELASRLLVQFPVYGTRSQAHTNSNLNQTADWLLGGTGGIPSQQQLLKQQKNNQKGNNNHNNNNADQHSPKKANTSSPTNNSNSNNNNNNSSSTEMESFDGWDRDEQDLWRTKAPMPKNKRSDGTATNHDNDNDNDNPSSSSSTKNNNNNGGPVGGGGYGVSSVVSGPMCQNTSNDPAREWFMAYYYHTGVTPQFQLQRPHPMFDRPPLTRSSTQTFPRMPSTSFSSPLLATTPTTTPQDKQQHKIHDIPEDHDEKYSELLSATTPSSTTSQQQQQQQQNKDDRQHWMPDRLCKSCYACDTPFTVFRRRHHCRLCGQVFCNTCSGYFVPSESVDKTILRTCKMCFEQVSEKIQQEEEDGRKRRKKEDNAPATTNVTGKESSSTPAVPPTGTSASSSSAAGSPPAAPVSPTLVEQLDKGENSNSVLLQKLSQKTRVESAFAKRRFLSQQKALEKEEQEQTSLILQDQQQRERQQLHLETVRTRNMLLLQQEQQQQQQEESQQMLSQEESSRSLGNNNNNNNNIIIQEEEQRCMLVEDGERHLGQMAANHLQLLGQELLRSDAPLLRQEIIPAEYQKWIHKLMGLATRCCATVEPNVKRGDLLDIRPYCKIKVIPGGSYNDCSYISGIVFRKTVSHKRMAKEIMNPRIMLLSGGIEFTRTENRIAQLETLMEQESKYMEILVGKILKLKPDILMVGRSVSRKAQELLLKARVVLIQHVKSTLLRRISRQTGATIISSTDHIMNQFGAHVLGKCYRFRTIVARNNEVWIDEKVVDDHAEHTSNPKIGNKIQREIKSLLKDERLPNYERQAALAADMLGEDILDGFEAVKAGLAKRGVAQTFIMLEGCPKHLGCTVVLRGASRAALKQVKIVFRFLVNAAYNLRLETSYFKERCARLRPEYHVQPDNLFSSSLCVDYGAPPNGRKIRPWNGSNNEGTQRSISGQITAFDQQAILISSVWMTDKTQCCPAEVKGICYYSMQDVSLGQFLRDSCFNLSLKCQNPNCKKSVLDHSLSFVHNDGLINITVDHMDDPLPPAPPATGKKNSPKKDDEEESDENDDPPIATWTYCKNCAKVVTPLVYISENSWKYSFGKFLESFFYNRDTIMNSPQSECKCQLQTCCTLYFGCGRLAARFTYERIRPFGVCVRKSLPIDTSFHRAEALRQLEQISMASSLLFVKFDKHIEKVSREARALYSSGANRPDHLQTVLSELNRIGSEVDHAAKTLQEKIASVSDKCAKEDESVVSDALLRFPWFARRYLFMLTSAWNEKLSAAGQAIVAMKKLASAAMQRNDGVIGQNVPAIVGDANVDELHEGMRRLRQLHEVYSRYNITDITTVLPIIPGNDSKPELEYDDDFEDPDGAIADFASEGVDADVLASRRRLYQSHSLPSEPSSRPPTKNLGTRREDPSKGIHHHRISPETIPNSTVAAKVTPGGAVKSAITRFFNRGGRETDPYVVNLGMFSDGRPRLEPGVNGIVVPVIDEQLCTVIAYSLSSTEYASQFQNYSKLDPGPSDGSSGAKAVDGSSTPGSETGVGRNFNESQNMGTPTSQHAGANSNVSEKHGIERRMLVRNKSHIKHTFRDFDEKGQNLCKFVCTTYWATQFHAVRQAFLSPHGAKGADSGAFAFQSSLDVEQSYVQSLSAAYSWAASGGKSGASFARTFDDRFVIKCISRTELQMFLDCAPAYFEYLSKAFFHGLPTVLCKIVGVYQIGYHNRVTGKRGMEQVAVMQNIFYNKKITKTFDLKGSLRGRFAAHKGGDDNHLDTPTNGSEASFAHRMRGSDHGSEGGDGESDLGSDRDDHFTTTKSTGTLLDGDFLEFTAGRPMPMNDRAKAVFHMSILNDTLFLSIINVLDYSILVGIDEEKTELVVGIIDFMRQYDILKQMERVGKSLPMVVGSEAPTIIQPPLYKARFTNAMERYFMTVPSKWTTI